MTKSKRPKVNIESPPKNHFLKKYPFCKHCEKGANSKIRLFGEDRSQFGFYPREVLADKINCTGDNRKMLKGKGSGILLRVKPLGRPSASAVLIHIRPGEHNPIEGKFGQAKTSYIISTAFICTVVYSRCIIK